MQLDALLAMLRDRDITLWVEGERLRFRAPKGAFTAELRERVSGAKVALIARLRSDAEATVAEGPATEGQRAHWLRRQTDANPAAYHVFFAVRVESTLDVSAARVAAQAILDRHAALRATFYWRDAQLLQRIPGAASIAFQHIHAPGYTDAPLQAAVARAALEPFDLVSGPLFRVICVTRAANDHALVLMGHHIVLDGASLFRLVAEFRTLYAEATGGPPSALEVLDEDAFAFANWQHDHLASVGGAELERYWRNALARPGRRLSLPIDRPRGGGVSHGQDWTSATIDADLLQALRAAAARERTTLFVLLMAAQITLMHRWTRADDVILGTPGSGRSRPEFETIVGEFVNTLPIRTRFAPGGTFRDVLAQVRDAVQGALDHQNLPFARIVEISQPTRHAHRAPLVESQFTLHKFSAFKGLEAALTPIPEAPAAEYGGLRIRHHPITEIPGYFDVSLQVGDFGDRLTAMWQYDRGLFEADAMHALRDDYIALLRAICADLHVRVETLPGRRATTAERGDATLKRLASRDIRCALDGARLKVNAPKGTLDEATKADISSNRDAILVALESRRDEQEADVVHMLEPVAGPGPHDASFAQRRLWFLDKFGAGAPIYNIGGSLRLSGPLDAERLVEAVKTLMARHEAFRTRFIDTGREPKVSIADQSVSTVDLVEAPGLDAEARDRQADITAREVLGARFDLAEGRLAIARILRFAPDDHVLSLAMHHIVSDGWSLAAALKEITQLYEGAASATPPLRYVDFAAWERRRAERNGFSPDLTFWRKALGGAPPVLNLPTDRPRPARQTFRGAGCSYNIPRELGVGLAALARERGATTFMALMALWQATLWRLSGQDDFVVGTPIGGRPDPTLEGVIGCFVNNLPLRADFSSAPSFTEALRRTRGRALDAFGHAAAPFDLLVETLNPARSMAHAPLFQTLFSYMSFPMETRGPGGVSAMQIEADPGIARFELAADVFEMPFGVQTGGLRVRYEYSTDLFDEATIARLHERFVALIAYACDQPEASLAACELATPTERSLLLDDWQGEAVEHDRARTIPSMLRASGDARLELVACVCGENRLTYRDLADRSHAVADALRAHAVKPGDRVVVCMERGVDLAIALAGVLIVGAAYVPLDPAHPPARRRFVAEDASVACILSDDIGRAAFEDLSMPILAVDAVGVRTDVMEHAQVDPVGLAYVIYTSGSTGAPKGVEVEHRQLVAFLEAMHQALDPKPDDVLLSVTTPAFDIAGLEIWLPLTLGARVVFATREEALDGRLLRALISRHNVRFLQATPATWRLLLESGWTGTPGLVALCGGEEMPRALAAALLDKVDALWNMYGPTETTIWSTMHRVTRADLDRPRIPIGHPIANTRVYVLEASGGLAPIGAQGELVIAGEGVARGYRNRPELTAERFCTINVEGREERAYRTGDAVAWLAEGVLDFIGRGDGQVKVRGFRIELGEIEVRLAKVPGVASAVASVREDTPGDKQIVAYVIASPNAPFDSRQALAVLRGDLPDYMLPSAFVALEAFPLSGNGKIDRAALPAPTSDRAPRGEASNDVLMSPAQHRVANIWKRVLKIERVGLHENFFDVGGHSLLVVQIQTALNAAFDRDVQIVELFNYTTVAAQTERMSGSEQEDVAVKRALARAGKQAHV